MSSLKRILSKLFQNYIYGLGKPYGIAYSPNGDFLVSIGSRGIVLWDTRNYKPIPLLDITEDSVVIHSSVVFNADGRTVLVVTQNDSVFSLISLDIYSGKQEILFAREAYTRLLDIDQQGDIVALQSENHVIELWDIKEKGLKAVLAGHTDVILSAKFTHNGHNLISTGLDAPIRFWDINTAKQKEFFSGTLNSSQYCSYES